MSEFGISVALLSPFYPSGALDTARLAAHATDMLARGTASVTLFGTTGEGASIGFAERETGIAAVRAAGVPGERLVVGLCACSVADASAQVAQGLAAGIDRFLVLPPFYFTGITEKGLFDWHAELFRATPREARFILYHIPQITGVPVPPRLAARLALAFPDRVLAIKDSSGDWQNAKELLADGALPVLIGDERLLPSAVTLGCAGAITGMANLMPERMCRLFSTAQDDPGLFAQVSAIVSGPVVPALKILLAHAKGDEGWKRTRAPLAPLGPDASRVLLDACAEEPADG